MRVYQFSLLPVIFLGLSLTACTRPQEGVGQVSIGIPHKMLSSKAGSLDAGNELLAHVVISITGEGLQEPRMVQWDAHSGSATATPPPAFTIDNLNVEKERLIQVLAVYKNSVSQKISFYYGDVSQMIPTPQADLSIPVLPIGNAQDVITGRVSGRYLTTANAGPTDVILVKYSPSPTKPALLIEQSPMINGWFSVFMLSGVNLDYVLLSGKTRLFGASGPISLESPLFDPAISKVMKATMPVHTRVENKSGVNIASVDDASVFAWGYWGAAGVDLSSKVICDDLATGTFSNVKIYSDPPAVGNTALTYSRLAAGTAFPTNAALLSTAAPIAVVNAKGGVATSGANCGTYSTASSTDRYTNFLLVNKTLLDGNGNDSVAGFRYIFGTAVGTTNVLNISPGASSGTIAGTLLPDIQSKISGLSFFKRVAASGDQLHLDLPMCSEISKPTNTLGFVPAGNLTSFNGDGSFLGTVQITTAEASSNSVSIVVCPVLSETGLLAQIGYFSNVHSSGGGAGAALATHFTLTYPATKMANSTCIPVTIQARTAGEQPGTVPQGTVLNFSTTDGNTNFHQFSGCSGSLTALSISGDVLGVQAQVYVKRANTGTASATLNLTPNNGLEARPYAMGFEDAPGSPNFSVRTVSPHAIPAHECIPISFETWHSDGSNSLAMDWIPSFNFNLPAVTGLTFHNFWDDNCLSGGPSSPTLGSGTLSQKYYMKYVGTANTISIHPESSAFEISGGTYMTGTNVPVLLPGAPAFVKIEMPMAIPSESCQMMTVRMVDAVGRTAPSPTAHTYSIQFNGSATLPANSGFYSDMNCSSGTSFPTFAVGDTRSKLYFRWAGSGALTITGTTATSGAPPLQAFTANVGAANVGYVAVRPSSVTFAHPNVFTGYAPMALEGQTFQLTFEAMSPLGNLVTTYTNPNASNFNLDGNYAGVSCGAITWSGGVGYANCTYLDPGPNYFSTALLGFYTQNSSLGIQFLSSDPRIRILRKAEATVMKDFLLSQDFGYSSNHCQPLMYARGPSSGDTILGAQAMALYTSSTISASSGVTGFYTDVGCSSSTATVALSAGQSAKIVYAKLNGGAATNINVGAELLFNYSTASAISIGNYTPSSFTSYKLSMTKDLHYGACTPVMIVRTDSNGNAVIGAGENVVMTAAGLTNTWHEDPDCLTADVSAAVPMLSGESARIIYLRTSTVTGSGSITATKQAGSETGSVTGLTVTP